MSSTIVTKTNSQKIALNQSVVEKFAAFAALILMLIIFSLICPPFRTVNNWVTIALQTSIIAFIGIGVTFVIITAGIDLGIGSVLALASVVTGLAMNAGYPSPLAILFGLIVGLLCGLFNGFVITRLKLPPFIATLGTMMIARGAALYITNAAPISVSEPLFDLLGGRIPGTQIPVPVLLMIVVALIFGFILRQTRLGRYAYAIGSNEEAARLSGLNINRTKYMLYAISGLLSAVAGIVLASRLSTAQATAGVSYELDAIASAVIGGTSLNGGTGTITGTMIGAFIIGVLRNGLNMMGVSSFIQQITIGGVIILAVYIDQLRNKKA
ncbi:monosaccharide ABC transporter membrane protein (CUT2 family) [Hydrogenispora ethanolica]|uniref:Monosaccharide ABC transporter membrane protein (CUT2 family) n=1 Tax=Hydrogenispora ethanolica TaxID=1082276 RepID=A0A4R1S9X8_HYDET|nr:ABC transporter permease [Hydrogenispora ethanolica]TCL76286.1 monosaccharide ABC transporter membrane protein (CUT2 family) [Hydrogenispora ethanolica]